VDKPNDLQMTFFGTQKRLPELLQVPPWKMSRLEWLLLINVLLALSQSIFFIFTGSLAVLSETGDSFADAASILVVIYSHKSIRHILINSLALGLRLTLAIKSIEELIGIPEVTQPILICTTAGFSILVNLVLILIGVDKDDGDEVELSWALFIDFGFDVISSVLSLAVGVVLFYSSFYATYVDKISSVASNLFFLIYQANLLRRNVIRHSAKMTQQASVTYDGKTALLAVPADPSGPESADTTH